MNSKNFNIFAGDRSYKTNFFLQFMSPRIERRFREEAFLRTRYSLRGFLVFSLVALSLHFMTTDCFTYGYSCRHPSMVLLAMASLIGTLVGLHFKIRHISLQVLVGISLVYFQIIFLEVYNYHTSLILMTLYASLASFLIQQVWFLQVINNLLAYGLLLGYAHFTSNQQMLKKPIPEFLIDLSIYNLIMTILLAFLEKGRKERWVLVETFKKSDKIFRQLYEEVPYAFFVIDKSKRILYSSQHGLALLKAFFKNCKSCNFNRVNMNLQDIIEPDYLPEVDEVFANASALNLGEEPSNCFIVLKPPSEEFDSTKCRFSFGQENLYKLKAIQTLWKTQYAYMVVLKDYSTKKKSEKITSKTVNYLTKQLHQMIEQYDEHPVDKSQMKFKSRILSKMMKIKFAAYNSLLIFHRIFSKSEGLKEKKTFNIRSSILSVIGVLSFKSKEKKCDLQIKFEHVSFPIEIFADKYLFQQTFANCLQMLLEILANTSITMDCKLATITPEGQYILSFEFKFPRNSKLTYDLLSSKLQAASPVSLDHVLQQDSISFFLALIVPAVEVFHGKIYADENDNDVILCLELKFEASGNSKAKFHSEWSTFKTMNYNASGNPNKDLYFWKCNNEEPPENSHEIEQAIQPAENNIASNKPKEPQIEVKPPAQKIEELSGKLGLKSTNSDQGIARSKMDEKKIRDELQKLSMKGMKNFGSQDDILVIPTLGANSNRKEEATEEAKKSTVLELQEEEKIDNESNLPTSSNLRGLSLNGFAGELAYDRITSAESSNSIPDIESFGKTQPALRIHQYTLKLSITKALMEIIDEQTKDKIKKNENANSEIVPTLEGVTVEERQDGFEIKESELLDKTLRHLSAKLVSQRRCDDFMQFAGRYVRELEDEIEKLQPMEELEQTTSDRRELYGMEPPEIGSVQSRPRKLESLGRKESSLKLFYKKQSRDSSFSRDSERSKEKVLNERFLMSPAINKTMTLRSALSLTAKSTDSGAFAFLQSPKVIPMASLQKSITAAAPPVENETSIVGKKNDMFNMLLPFGYDEQHLPHHLSARVYTHHRRWIGAPNKIESNTPERMFIYNDTFTILAVDDSAFVFKGLEHLPVKYKMKFEFAKNGTEALKKYLSNINQGILYHFILLDLQMPVMDGFETARVIRAEEANKNYPATYICAMSAFEDQETINRARREGMDNFCQKPLRSEVLNNLIKSRCEMIGIKAVEPQVV